MSHLVQTSKGAVYRRCAGLILNIQAALREPQVKVTTSLVGGVLNTLQHCLVRALAELISAGLLVNVCPLVTICFIEFQGDLNDIVATIGIAAQDLIECIHVGMGFRSLIQIICYIGLTIGKQQLIRVLSAQALLADNLNKLHVTRGNGATKDVHLTAVVIDIVLTEDVIICVLHHIAHGIAQRYPATMAHMQRTGGISRDELVIDLETVTYVGTTKILTLLANGTNNLIVCSGTQIKVNKARTSYLYLCNGGVGRHVINDCLGNLCGSHTSKTSRSKSNGGSPLTMIGISWTLNTTILYGKFRQV